MKFARKNVTRAGPNSGLTASQAAASASSHSRMRANGIDEPRDEVGAFTKSVDFYA
jgi:hypothetical protein